MEVDAACHSTRRAERGAYRTARRSGCKAGGSLLHVGGLRSVGLIGQRFDDPVGGLTRVQYAAEIGRAMAGGQGSFDGAPQPRGGGG